ncbi:MAG: prepilin-type N-terminal cleavage/methylation domain-containing protein [Acidobacteriia bacterium]|nr:prepilin-type N-terminal cleavage/methylation domain-containing protein [Terriglobia bacterium]
MTMERKHTQSQSIRSWRGLALRHKGFSIVELLIVLVVGMILTAIAIPMFNRAMINMRLNSTVSGITGAISKARYRAIYNSQVYTLAITTPANTYVVTNANANTADPPVPLPSQAVVLNGGGNATYTFTLCPNGMVYGAGGVCPGNNTAPALAVAYQGRQINVTVSSVGNATTTIIK